MDMFIVHTMYAREGPTHQMADVCLHTHRIFQFFCIRLAYLLCMRRLPLPVCPLACLSLSLPVSLFKHLANIISVYCKSCLCMSYLHC